MKRVLDAHAKTAEEREDLSTQLEKEASERRKIEKTKGMLLGKLQAMEAKLIQVGDDRERYPSMARRAGNATRVTVGDSGDHSHMLSSTQGCLKFRFLGSDSDPGRWTQKTLFTSDAPSSVPSSLPRECDYRGRRDHMGDDAEREDCQTRPRILHFFYL